MPLPSSGRLLSELEASRYRFGREEATGLAKLLAQARATRFHDVSSLIRFHEVLMVLRAFPPSARVLQQCESLLNLFWRRVGTLRAAGAGMDDFDPIEVSRLAGTALPGTVGFGLMRWLGKRVPPEPGDALGGYRQAS